MTKLRPTYLQAYSARFDASDSHTLAIRVKIARLVCVAATLG